MPSILLNPGPVTLTDRVRGAMAKADWCHREPEFAALTQSINARLAGVYDTPGDDYVSVLLTGSGTLAVEAMLTSFAPVKSRTLVVANGVYGERMATMLETMGRPCEVLSAEWDAPIDLAAVEEALIADPGISHVATVHHETTTGRLNPVGEIGALCARLGRALLLDAVSSFGAEEINFHDWNLAAVAATANKCLHGVPGLSFVIAQREALAETHDSPGSMYLDLRRYYSAQHGDGYSPFTQAVQVAFALDAALDEFHEDGGWQQRGQRYRDIGSAVREHLRGLDIATLLPEEDYSSVMCSYRIPSGTTYDVLHDVLKAQGFIIYAGQAQFAERIFRIAHMGAISNEDVGRLNRALADFFEDAR
ncbi:MAG: 2-aminoethylphosphonate--pyruvate transaminase [Gammaproteobacteria bacterium]|nr:2-aminoethylphosphonate--pyruvate transaminase [Gammaproteobacteria bacterium]